MDGYNWMAMEWTIVSRHLRRIETNAGLKDMVAIVGILFKSNSTKSSVEKEDTVLLKIGAKTSSALDSSLRNEFLCRYYYVLWRPSSKHQIMARMVNNNNR